jgi:hypothetical protein
MRFVEGIGEALKTQDVNDALVVGLPGERWAASWLSRCRPMAGIYRRPRGRALAWQENRGPAGAEAVFRRRSHTAQRYGIGGLQDQDGQGGYGEELVDLHRS